MIDVSTLAVVVPPLDEFGLPAPAGLFQFLIVLTMLLHVIVMSFALGGPIIASVLDVLTLAKRGNHNHTVRIIWQVMPVAISLTITTGVAPLLFVQVLYGQFFYSSTIFMGFGWFALVPILIVAFYMVYFLSYRLGNVLSRRLGRWNRNPGKRLPITLVIAALIMAVGWIMTNNHMLQIQPDIWGEGGEWRQDRLMVSPGLTHPRYAHILTGALAVTGLWLAACGYWRRRRNVDPPEIALAVTRTGLWTALPLILVASIMGLGVLFTLPSETRAALMSLGGYALLFWIGVAGVAGQLVFGALALVRPHEFRWFGGLSACALVGLVGMVAGRELIRLSFLGRAGIDFSLGQWPVHTQTSPMLLFLGLFVATLAIVAWLTWISATGRSAATDIETEA